MGNGLYKVNEIKSKEQLKKNKDYSSMTEMKKDGQVLAQLWFYNKTCYYIARNQKGKEMVLKYINSMNEKLLKKWEDNRQKQLERERRREEMVTSYTHFYEKPGIHFVDGHVFFSRSSPLSGSAESFFSVRVFPGSDFVYYFRTADQYFEWIKAVVHDDFDMAYFIKRAKNNGRVIKLGHLVRNYDDEHWKSIRETIMMSILIRWWWRTDLKYDTLIDPVFDNRHFVNADPNDRVWGIGFSAKDALKHKDEWGENLLGKCYDKLREILLKKDTDPTEYNEYWRFGAANGCRILDDMPLF